jgi:hypothetical protein
MLACQCHLWLLGLFCHGLRILVPSRAKTIHVLLNVAEMQHSVNSLLLRAHEYLWLDVICVSPLGSDLNSVVVI